MRWWVDCVDMCGANFTYTQNGLGTCWIGFADRITFDIKKVYPAESSDDRL
jgi:hypothetical protein